MPRFTRRDYDRAEDFGPDNTAGTCDHGVSVMETCDRCVNRTDDPVFTEDNEEAQS